MSASRKPSDLLGDAGVLDDEPVLEVFDWAAVQRAGGLAVLPLRGDWKAALAVGVEAVPLFSKTGGHSYRQAVVHLQKGRAATEAALAHAWESLEIGGRLLLVGGNELGVKSAVKRLAEAVAQEPVILANRAHARVAAFERTSHPGPVAPSPAVLTVECKDSSFTVTSGIGVFSGEKVDTGTQVVLDFLGELTPSTSVLDMGCGIGILGLAALRCWPQATAVLADVDRRAVAGAQSNAENLGLSERCRVVWWDALTEAAPVEHCDLIVINPPFHTGKAVDLSPARAMFRAADQVLELGGTMMVVANRSLPYEHELEKVGRLRKVRERAGFKLLEVRR